MPRAPCYLRSARSSRPRQRHCFGFSRFAQAGAHRGVLMGFAVLGSYDASYLELALREGRLLVTLDADLQRAMVATDGVVI